eukprot:15970-Heterococcus_DN1.PRE.5
MSKSLLTEYREHQHAIYVAYTAWFKYCFVLLLRNGTADLRVKYTRSTGYSVISNENESTVHKHKARGSAVVCSLIARMCLYIVCVYISGVAAEA